MSQDAIAATRPYRVRVGGVWYWVDPTACAIEPGDTIIAYPTDGGAYLAILQGQTDDEFAFATLEGERFSAARAEFAALHLAAVDDHQD